MSENHECLRQRLRESAKGHVPHQFLDEVVDLALHARDRAFAAIGPIALSASNTGVAMCATGIALSLITAEAQDKLKRLTEFTIANGGAVSTSVGGANG